MKRAALAILALVLVLTGCVKADVTAELKGNTARIAYAVRVDTAQIDEGDMENARISAKKAVDGLLASGFDVTYSLDGVEWTIDAAYTRTGGDRAEAAALFHDMVTDPAISPFHIVDFSYSIDALEDAYYFEGLLNTPQVITLDNIAFLPPEDAQRFYDAEEAGVGSITLSLPGTTCYMNEGQVSEWEEGFTVTAPISLLTESKVSLATTMAPYGTLSNMATALETEFDECKGTLTGIAALFCVLTVVFIVISVKRRKER